MTLALKPLVARDRHESHRAATQLELFFDLVSVIAIAAVTAGYHHAISEGHGLEMLPNFIFIFVGIWWVWLNFTWYASAFDNDDMLHRILTIVLMGGSLTFAAGASHIFETLDFSYGLAGWIIMRSAMILMWLRVAASGPDYRVVGQRYAIGIAFTQVLWTIFYFTVVPGSAGFFLGAIGIYLVEFSVPMLAERTRSTPWHRHHIMERYGLLNIIVLGEVLLSSSLVLRNLYDGHFDLALVTTAASGLVLVFAIWWVYFIEADHLASTDLNRAFTWGYGHIFIFASGAMLGAGLGAYMDVLTRHSEITASHAATYINGAVAVYFLALWMIRDRFCAIGWRSYTLLVTGLLFIPAAVIGIAPWYTALIAVAALFARLPRIA